MMEYEKSNGVFELFVACLKAYALSNSEVEVNWERVRSQLLSPRIAVVVFVEYRCRTV